MHLIEFLNVMTNEMNDSIVIVNAMHKWIHWMMFWVTQFPNTQTLCDFLNYKMVLSFQITSTVTVWSHGIIYTLFRMRSKLKTENKWIRITISSYPCIDGWLIENLNSDATLNRRIFGWTCTDRVRRCM